MAGDAGELLALLFRHSPMPQFVSDATGRVVMANPAYAALVGQSMDEVIGSVPADVAHPDDLRQLLAQGARLLDREIDVFELDVRITRADGDQRWCAVTCTLAEGPAAQPLFVSHVLDITEQREHREELARSHARFRALSDSLPVGIHQRDPDGRLLYANHQWEDITGLRVEDALGADQVEIVHPEDRDRLLEASIRLARDGGDYHEQFRILRPDGSQRWVSSRAVWLRDDDGRRLTYLGSLEDITDLLGALEEQQRLRDELAHQATHDALTGLPNRVLLLDKLERAVSRADKGSAVAVLFVDLDRFKLVNDELGHDVGDELLRAVADRMCTVLRPTDVVARLGGDEFVVLCPDVSDPEQASDLARRLVLVVSKEPFAVRGRELDVTASVGVTVSAGGPDQHPEGLLREADAAMYRAKATGRDRYEVFDAALRGVDTDGRLDAPQSTGASPPDQVENSSE